MKLCSDAFRNLNPDRESEASTASDSGYTYSKHLLHSVTIPASVTEIEAETFSGCQNLVKVNFAENAEITFGSGVFGNCTALSEISLPAGTRALSEGMFSGCSSLKTVNFTDLKLVTEIPATAFYECGLSELRLPDSVTVIGKRAFENCHITKLVIPDSVTEIGELAFRKQYLGAEQSIGSEADIGRLTASLTPKGIYNDDGDLVRQEFYDDDQKLCYVKYWDAYGNPVLEDASGSIVVHILGNDAYTLAVYCRG